MAVELRKTYNSTLLHIQQLQYRDMRRLHRQPMDMALKLAARRTVRLQHLILDLVPRQ